MDLALTIHQAAVGFLNSSQAPSMDYFYNSNGTVTKTQKYKLSMRYMMLKAFKMDESFRCIKSYFGEYLKLFE